MTIEPEGARAAIVALVDGEVAAWNRGDAAAFSADVLEDCVFTNIFGQTFTGREPFERQHAAIFATIYQGSTLTQEIAHLRFPRPDVAILDTHAELSVPEGPLGPARTVRTRLLQVLVDDGKAWGIASYHNVEIRPPPGAPQAR